MPSAIRAPEVRREAAPDGLEPAVGVRTAPRPRRRGEHRVGLLRRLAAARCRVAVVGAGYVGLAVATEAARVGFLVTCVDVDGERVAALNAGRSPVDDVSDETIAALRQQQRLEASADFLAAAQAEVVVICVPTPLTASKEPDLTAIRSAAAELAPRLRPGQLVVLESTTYPGTTEEVLRPALEASGLRAGEDFWLAFSPERVDPGNTAYTLRTTPKIVGGVDPASTEMAAAFYGRLVDRVVPVSSAAAAEMVKLYENVFRNINIAFANEMAQLCDRMGLNVWEVIEAAATKPFGFMAFYPGPGVGGHCIPIDPHYLSWKARQFDFEVRFVNLAADVNANMPHYLLSRVMRALNERGRSLKGSVVLVLGVAYKPDVADTRESPAYKLIPLLERAGATVCYHDPYVPELAVRNGGGANGGEVRRLLSAPLSAGLLASCDCVVVLTDHRCLDYQAIAEGARLVVDARNALRHCREAAGTVVRL